MGSIPVHFAWSRDLYQSAAVTFTVNADKHHAPPDGKSWMGRCRALRSEPANLKSRRGQGQIWVDNLENTLRWSRGAIGRYQAAPGAPLAAVRVPGRDIRWPWAAPTTTPPGWEGG